MGQYSEGDWVANFEWFVRKDSIFNVLNGFYDNEKFDWLENKNRKEEKTDGEYQQFIYDDGSRNEEDNRPSPADVLRAAIEAAEAKERNE